MTFVVDTTVCLQVYTWNRLLRTDNELSALKVAARGLSTSKDIGGAAELDVAPAMKFTTERENAKAVGQAIGSNPVLSVAASAAASVAATRAVPAVKLPSSLPPMANDEAGVLQMQSVVEDLKDSSVGESVKAAGARKSLPDQLHLRGTDVL